jgi:hypothetical protein
MNEPIGWLLEGPPWVQYRTRLDLLGQPENNPQVAAARQAMMAHQQVQALLTGLSAWSGPTLKRRNDANLLLHKLAFAADLGLRADDPGVGQIVERILDHQSPEDPFQVQVNIPTHFGGSGEDQWTWILCDTPLLLYALRRFGLGDGPRLQAAAHYLASLVRENGWPCAATPEMGKFRGPGRKIDPCPYATLLMLRGLYQMPEWRDSGACRTGAEVLLNLWEQRKRRRPYLFGMGTNFAKLKAPLIWYDILHLMDVLTQLPWLRGDARLREMADIVAAKPDGQGRFTPESVWKAWGGWEFGQKRSPSQWLTLLAQRMLKRMNSSR